ncbi:hypothetical protein PFISCL1PPCAC_21962 [Pristionchus fissidentatus]|uniref:Uncharacterized protein n=1 Tax=Pristionchus fissidentatus TaxID=1538716 RepID=A0AAV5WG69_9BILA|nr:hypothetical protein PFISCL1PPCAC_21962 [Pristionchus fissidentatus]
MKQLISMKAATDQSESYLTTTAKYDTLSKLKFADQFRLNLLRDHCLLLYTTFDQIKTLKTTTEYRCFSDSMKAAICDRMMEF